MPNLLFLAVSFGMWIDLEIPVEHISSLTETAASKISLVKDIENQPLDTQWAGVGEAYLLYKRNYDPTNGLIQLENLSKFFTYPPAQHLFLLPQWAPFSPRSSFGGLKAEHSLWSTFAVKGHG